jgi:RHS repeat-associated protein
MRAAGPHPCNFFFAFNPKPATFGLRSLKPVAVVERQADTYTTLLVGTDHLGSIVGLFSNDGRLVQKLSYDAWGNRRNPDSYSQPFTEVPRLRRGFTGHEQLDTLGLINMNGRMYDPVLGRFLSPDDYVQAPDFTQSFNRYSYCLNNPLMYTDPSGEFIWTIITGVHDFLNTAFFKGGLDPTSKTARQNAWRDFDPTAPWSATNKAWKIDIGLFKTDPNKNFGGRVWEFISRFTWQAPQTVLGYTSSGVHNLLGGVKSVDYYGGATVVESYARNWGAITLGSYIIGSRGITADPNNRLFQHEYGHYIQSQTSGLFYLSKYGIPSALSKSGTDHSLHPAEQDANIRAFKYFNKHIDNYSGWYHDPYYGNPINGYDPSLSYTDPANQAALRNGRLRLSWYDYLLGPNIIVSGLLNALILNHQY